MPICSYLAFPLPGKSERVRARLARLPGCDVTPAKNQDVLLLVTDTDSPEEEGELRAHLEAIEGLAALVLTFGEVDPQTAAAVARRAPESEAQP